MNSIDMVRDESEKVIGPVKSWLWTSIVIVIGFVPLFIYWTCIYIVWPWRWFECFDPEGVHFAAGLSILKGHGPGNVDNPATPLQTLSAILSWITGCGILDLEKFRPWAYFTTIVLRIAAACVFQRFVIRELPVCWQIAVLWLPWLAPEFAMMSRQWCPETMYYPLGVLSICVIFSQMNQSSRWQNAFLVGGAIGIMIGVKFIFVAWALAAILAIGVSYSPRIAIRSCLSVSLGTVTGFALATFPAVTRYPRMLEWLTGLAMKSGQYGSGPSRIVDLEKVRSGLIEMILHEKVWMLVVIITTILLVTRRPRTCLSIFCVLAIGGSYALSLKHFAPRYLAPTGLIVLLAAVELLKNSEIRKNQWAGISAFAIVGLLIWKTLSFDVSLQRVFVAEKRESNELLENFLRAHGRTDKSVILYGWRAFVPAFSVRFMSQGELHRFDQEADIAFPYEGLINIWPTEVYYPAGKSEWDFIVVGEEFQSVVDPKGLNFLRQKYQSWKVGRYVVLTRNEIALPEHP